MVYQPRILNQDTYKNDVRNKLGISASYLPDGLISDDLHLAPAEAWVISLVPDWETIKQGAGDDSVRLYAATIFAVCAELCDSIPQILPTLERDMDTEIRHLQIDWSKREQEFQEKALEKIGEISTHTEDFQGLLWAVAPIEEQ